MKVLAFVGKGGRSAEIGVSTCRYEDFDAESFREKIYLVTKQRVLDFSPDLSGQNDKEQRTLRIKVLVLLIARFNN